MNDCDAIRDQLKAYQDGSVSPVLRWRVRRHLARCSACREELNALTQISHALRTAEAGGLDPILRQKILARIPEGVAPMPTQPVYAASHRPRPTLLYVSSAAALAVVGGLFFLPNALRTVSEETKRAKVSASSAPASAAANKAAPMDAEGENGKRMRQRAADQPMLNPAKPEAVMQEQAAPATSAPSPTAPPAEEPSNMESASPSFGAGMASKGYQSGGGRAEGRAGSFGSSRPGSSPGRARDMMQASPAQATDADTTKANRAQKAQKERQKKRPAKKEATPAAQKPADR